MIRAAGFHFKRLSLRSTDDEKRGKRTEVGTRVSAKIGVFHVFKQVQMGKSLGVISMVFPQLGWIPPKEWWEHSPLVHTPVRSAPAPGAASLRLCLVKSSWLWVVSCDKPEMALIMC